jgi:succinyl-CoA synthetase beta subunit
VTNAEKALHMAEKMLGHRLITKQTGEHGKPCNKILIQERLYARRELYFAIVLDRAFNGPVLVASQRGGMNIEEVAQETPEEIFKEPIDIKKGLTEEQAETVAHILGLSNIKLAVQQFQGLWKLFIENDSTLLEINPLVETPELNIICSDAKINFDDNSDFKHKELFEARDESQEDEREVRARRAGLSYIGLDGNIGCIVNGAGLAMATMDIIKLYGGSPANFLDVGGGANQQQLQEALKILNDDKKVQAILVNIFVGIMRCDLVALGIIAAAKETKLRVPLVVRLQGTNFMEAKQIMDASEMKVIPADDLELAAQSAVRMATIMEMAKDINVKVTFELPL